MKLFLCALIFAFCLVSVVRCFTVASKFETSLVGSENCLRGPKYWCNNFSSAVECSAINHCIQTVWQNQRSSKDESCQICEEEIQKLRDTVTSNTTQEVIEEAFDYICEITIVTRMLRKECEKLIHDYVTDYIDELLVMLRSSVDSAVICGKLGFCVLSNSQIEVSDKDEVVVRFENVVLHIPASMLHLPEQTSPLLGSKKCTWGPSYWCNNITSAKECKSTSHCIENVWKSAEFSEDNDSVCQVCKEMVKEARDQLLSNETQDELKQVLEGSCKLIPVNPVKTECIKLADEFIPELTEMLASQMNPTAVCTVSGLCNSPRIDNLLASASANSVASDACANCTIAFTAVEKYLKTSPKNDLLNKLLLVCGQLSSYSDSCNYLVVTYYDDLYTMLYNELKPHTACHLSGMCAYKFHFHPTSSDVSVEKTVASADDETVIVSDDLACDLCKQLIHHFKEILVANTTKEEFLQILEGICKQTKNFKNECLSLVQENYQIIYDFITMELDPSKICFELTLCPKSKNTITDNNLNLINTPILLAYPVATENRLPAEENTTSASTTTTECRFCKYIIELVQKELEQPELKNNIEEVIENICGLVSRSEKSNCKSFVDEYSATLIKILADETDPGIVCALIHFCPDVRRPANTKTSANLCPYCQYLMHFIQEELEKPDTQKDIEKTVKIICNIVPSAEAKRCDEFIDEYSALIISVLSEEMDPALVCPAIKLCPSLHSPEMKCDYCDYVLNNFIRLLRENHEEENIVEQMRGFVRAVPKNMTSVALELKVNHREDIVDMMMAEFDSEESCLFLQFCNVRHLEAKSTKNAVTDEIHEIAAATSNENAKTNEIHEIAASAESKPSASCELCQLLVSVYENQITSKTTEKELEGWFLKRCSLFKDEDLINNCTSFVRTYVPALIDLIKTDVKPKDLCELAKICSVRSLITTGVPEECRTCEIVLGSLQSLVNDPTVMRSIQKSTIPELGKLCNLIDGKYKSFCLNIIYQVFSQAESIALSLPSWFYCSRIDLCPYRSSCHTEGESYWCQDANTATLCDKLMYCQEKVWKSDKPPSRY